MTTGVTLDHAAVRLPTLPPLVCGLSTVVDTVVLMVGRTAIALQLLRPGVILTQ